MSQLTLPFEHLSDYLHGDFIVSNSNAFAYESIKDYLNWPEKRFLIVGEAGSGKTHLARIWQMQVEGILLRPGMEWGRIVEHIAAVVDNIEQWVESPEALLHVINQAQENGRYLLMTGSHIPVFSLPDLQSRLNATYKVEIKAPDQALMKAVIVKQLSDRQLSIKPEVLDYLSHHAERSFAAVQKLVAVMDQLAMQEKRGITVPLVKKVLENT